MQSRGKSVKPRGEHWALAHSGRLAFHATITSINMLPTTSAMPASSRPLWRS